MLASTRPEIVLCLSLSGACRALGVKRHVIDAALDQGILEARRCGKHIKVPCFGPKGLEALYLTWPLYTRRKVPKT